MVDTTTRPASTRVPLDSPLLRGLQPFTGWSTAMQKPGGQTYFWVPIVGPLIGGAIGVYVYDWFVGNFLPIEGEVGEVVEADRRPEATT